MSRLLRVSVLIDRLNRAVGRSVPWLVLVMVVVSAGNAVVRYTLNTSSNAWLEVQWYLFSAVFLLTAGYTLLRDEHVRIDVLTGRFPPRVRAWIDVVGGVLFLLPMAATILVLSWPMVADSFIRGEMSGDAGGLLRWPVKALIPLGFLLLALQGISQIIKKLAFLSRSGDE